MMQRVEREFAGRKLIVETGRMAKQAAGSALVQYGETMVLAAITVSDKVSTLPFFPLTVEYKERTYAAGKIPGGFIKREGRPHDDEILSARIIDRSIRPLFPEGFQNEVQVFVYVISADQENDADVLALLARLTRAAIVEAFRCTARSPACAWAACRTSGWSTPPSSSSPTATWTSSSPGSKDSIVMVEGGALEVSEDDIVDGITLGHRAIQELIADPGRAARQESKSRR